MNIMDQGNLARKINNISVANPKTNRQVSSKVKTNRLSVSLAEKALIVFSCLVLVGLMLAVVSSKIALTNAQHNLQQLDDRITQVHNKNTNLKQQIGELKSSSRLEAIAKKSQMTLNNSNIRNVTK